MKNEDQYEALKDKSGVRRRTTSQGWTTAQKKAAGRQGGRATARKRAS